jgi:1-acyl-sn-glycerol-3-phosphate acyltransferase
LIVPVAHNAGQFWPRNRFAKRPGMIELEVGRPIDPKGKSVAELTREYSTWIEETSARLAVNASSDSGAMARNDHGTNGQSM